MAVEAVVEAAAVVEVAVAVKAAAAVEVAVEAVAVEAVAVIHGNIDFPFRFPMVHGSVRHGKFHGKCYAAGIRA